MRWRKSTTSSTPNSLNRVVHRGAGAFWQFTFLWIPYYEKNKSNGLETGKLRLYLVVSNLAFRSETAGLNPVFVKFCSLFNFLKISQKEFEPIVTFLESPSSECMMWFQCISTHKNKEKEINLDHCQLKHHRNACN